MSLPAASTQDQGIFSIDSRPGKFTHQPHLGPFPEDNISTAHPRPPIVTQAHGQGIKERDETGTSALVGRLRSASKKFEDSNLPKGMWDATASIASSISSLVDIRRGSFGNDGWSAEGQIEERERIGSIARHHRSRIGDNTSLERSLSGPKSPVGICSPGSVHQDTVSKVIVEKRGRDNLETKISPSTSPQLANGNNSDREANNNSFGGKQTVNDLGENLIGTAPKSSSQDMTAPFNNGYHFPPKHTWTDSTVIFLTGFWKYSTTWLGFIVVIYGLNIVAWGGMIFLLLCNAAPAMCYPTCDDINSPRRVWIEIDAQVLTALFCVTGFGLIPWRFRDLYYLLKFRLKNDQKALRRLAGIHRDWFRLEGSKDLPVLLGPENIESECRSFSETYAPYPLKSISNAPLTGIRASPTPVWKLDYVIWMFVWNTLLQAVLSGIMWGLNRYDRPSWSTGVFVALACIVAACGGIMIFVEGKKVKEVEGIPISPRDQERLKKDSELGILHVNNIKDAIPKDKERK